MIVRKCEELELEIRTHFSRDRADCVAEVVQEGRESEHRKCKLRQVNKYDRVKEKSSTVENTTQNQQKERCVVKNRILS